MPAYANLVTNLTNPTNPAATLTTVRQFVDGLSEENMLEVVQEPGLLDALNKLIVGNTAFSTLYVLFSLVKGMTTERLCQAAVFDSSCFPSLKNMAATGSTLELKQLAWSTLTGIACMKEERLMAMLDSPDMAALLQSGLKSADADIATGANCTLSNLCRDEKTASAVLDDHPHLVQALVDTFSTSGVCDKFERKSLLHTLSFFCSPSP